MQERISALPQAGVDFYTAMHGKRIIIDTLPVATGGPPPRYAGTLEAVYDDSLVIRPDNGRLVLIFKHAMMGVSEADVTQFSNTP
jgi:hypothetical protein